MSEVVKHIDGDMDFNNPIYSEHQMVRADSIGTAKEMFRINKAFIICVEIAMMIDADLNREEAIKIIQSENVPNDQLPLLCDQMRAAVLLKTQIEAFNDECSYSGLIHKLILDKSAIC